MQSTCTLVRYHSRVNLQVGCRLDAEAGNMVGCYYHAHRPQDGQWLPADSMPKTKTGQPIAYVAKGAHGLYTGVCTLICCHWSYYHNHYYHKHKFSNPHVSPWRCGVHTLHELSGYDDLCSSAHRQEIMLANACQVAECMMHMNYLSSSTHTSC